MAILSGRVQLLLLYLLLSPPAAAQVNEYQLKAAFLYNFVKFVDWPARTFQDPAQAVGICVLGQSPFGDTLQQTVAGKLVAGRALEIHGLPSPAPASLHTCHILFVPGSESKRFREIAAPLKATPVLTVGEAGDFLDHGGMIAFKVERGTVRFEINLAAADCAQIKISSKLLSLAQAVRRSP
jgi:hypothetical protein